MRVKRRFAQSQTYVSTELSGRNPATFAKKNAEQPRGCWPPAWDCTISVSHACACAALDWRKRSYRRMFFVDV